MTAAMEAFLVNAFQAADGYPDVMRLQQRHGRDPFARYPLAFWPQVTQATEGSQIDPILVLALIRQESMFDPEARSHADARGLMQLLPSTARYTALESGRPAPQAEDLYDPDLNIDLGVTHLRQLLRLYDGDRFRSLAAYNGGRDAVAKWDRRFPRLETDEWVESISYRETRDYVKRVFSNYRMYQELYGTRVTGRTNSVPAAR